MVQERPKHKWTMVVDIDRCSGCQACVVACQAENNITINEQRDFLQRRAKEWIRIERYWEAIDPSKPAEFPNVKARFIPIMCQQCDNAPCEPVCPVYATYHNNEGLNVQVYNRCVGTRYCANNCPYQVRFFNFWEPVWPESLRNQLNPDVTVRSRGIMEKCTFCVQRLSRARRTIEGRRGKRITDESMTEENLMPACVMACPTGALVFGDREDPKSRVNELLKEHDPRQAKSVAARGYRVLEDLTTEPNVVYLKKVDPHLKKVKAHA
ncbi:MAG: 4Fe-4S dicluster domain-containing protein [Chloroflexi bacterium]|nr:4Fe-4S dicluster domain-containing protein [Chloroflexota bacterium]